MDAMIVAPALAAGWIAVTVAQANAHALREWRRRDAGRSGDASTHVSPLPSATPLTHGVTYAADIRVVHATTDPEPARAA